MTDVRFRLCCSAAYDEYVICHLEPDHEGPHRGSDWPRRKDGKPDRRWSYNAAPDKEWT